MLPIEQIHPAVVHFPIVFTLCLLGVDLWYTARGRALTRGRGAGGLAATVAGLAAIGALVAFVFGDQSYDIAAANGAPMAPLEMHEGLGTTTAMAILAWGAIRAFLWWRSVPIAGGRAWGVVLVDVALAGLIVATAFYGGRLVYDYGVAVSAAGVAPAG